MYRQSEKIVTQQYLLHVSPQYGELRPTNGSGVWGTEQISTGFASCLRYYSDVARQRPTKLCTMFGRLLRWYTIYTFWGLLSANGFSPATKFTLGLRPSLAFSYIASVTARHSSSGRQPNFVAWYKELNYRTFAEGATYIRLGGHRIGHRPTF